MKSKKILFREKDILALSLLKSCILLCAFVLILAIAAENVVAWTQYLTCSGTIQYDSSDNRVKGWGGCTGVCGFTLGKCRGDDLCCDCCPLGQYWPACGGGQTSLCPPSCGGTLTTTLTLYKQGGAVANSATCTAWSASNPCSLTSSDCSAEGQYYAIWDRQYGSSGTCSTTTCSYTTSQTEKSCCYFHSFDSSTCNNFPRYMRINTRYVSWDAYKSDCECKGKLWTAPDITTDTGKKSVGYSGPHCCGDDGATETYEDSGSSRNCCYKGLMLLHKSVGDGITIPNDLFCYDGKFYSCNHYYDFVSYNTGSCYQVGGYYCMPPPGNKWIAGTGEGVSCGDCKKCATGECKNLCVPCQYCSAGQVCAWLGPEAEDKRCGVNGSIDCGGWYSKSGRKGPDDDDIQQCWSYANITSAQCKTQGCKEANSSDCTTWSYPAYLKYECGECKYIQDGDCINKSLGNCTNYPINTPCMKGTYYGTCTGGGVCDVITECADGTPVGTCSANKPKYCNPYDGILYDDCSRCGCPADLICLVSGHCIDPDFDCSKVLSPTECNNNAPTCFWNGTGCSSCLEVTSCASYTYSKEICEADVCEITKTSSNCSWNGASCKENVFTEDCSNGIDDDGDWLVDCADPDCSSTAYCKSSITCGDGVINSGEECDIGIFPYGLDSCTAFGFGGGTLACNPPGSPGQCKFDFSKCTDPISEVNCSNGMLNSGESCDGTQFVSDASCESIGFFSGTLGCLNCHFDTQYCVGAVTQESNPEACWDEVDNDNDDYVDYMDADCQSQDPTVERIGGNCMPGNTTAIATLTYTYYLRFEKDGVSEVTKTDTIKVTCPSPVKAIVPFFSLLCFLITLVLLFVYYFLREKKFIKA